MENFCHYGGSILKHTGGAWVAPKMVTPPLNSLPAQAQYRTQGPAAHNMVLEHLFVEAGPAVTSVCIKGPAVARFELAPTLDLEAPVSARQELHPSGPLRSLRISGHLANSVYTQLHSALPVLGPSLKELRVSGVHQWSRVISAGQVRLMRGRNAVLILRVVGLLA